LLDIGDINAVGVSKKKKEAKGFAYRLANKNVPILMTKSFKFKRKFCHKLQIIQIVYIYQCEILLRQFLFKTDPGVSRNC